MVDKIIFNELEYLFCFKGIYERWKGRLGDWRNCSLFGRKYIDSFINIIGVKFLIYVLRFIIVGNFLGLFGVNIKVKRIV